MLGTGWGSLKKYIATFEKIKAFSKTSPDIKILSLFLPEYARENMLDAAPAPGSRLKQIEHTTGVCVRHKLLTICLICLICALCFVCLHGIIT